MVRGRRARVNDSTAVATATSIANGAQLVEDQYCASPKRKDCRIDDVPNSLKAVLQTMSPDSESSKETAEEISTYEIFGTKTRSQTAIHFFRDNKMAPITNGVIHEFYTNGNTIGAELEIQASNSSLIDLSEDACDGLSSHCTPMKNFTNQMSSNIFLQAPVLSLNVDKSPNQASSIKINKTLEVDPVFPSNGYHQLNGQFNKIVSLRSSSLESTNTFLLNTDSNSCDSGVVVEKQLELSPSKRRKPTTPHRILCPSPVKHAIVEKSPATALSHLNGHGPVASNVATGNVNGMQKRNPKSRRRLNTTQSENKSSMTSPQIVGGVTLTNEALKKINSTNCSQKFILNSAKNPTAEQNTNNNFKLTQQKHRSNGHQQPRERNLQQKLQGPADTNKKLTDFFPVRRSIRKTKKAVQEEMMRSIEKAIIEGRDDGLKVVENFEGKGRGIIADRLFKRGEFVVEYIGDLVNITQANEREAKYSLDENAGCYMYYFKHRNQQYCIDATAETGKLGRLVNHSRIGNLITKVVVVKNHPHLVLIAKDDIQAGEELTYDYGDRSKESLIHHPWLAL